MAIPDLPLVELLHAAAREVSTLFEGELKTLRITDITARQAVAILVLERHPRITQKALAELTDMDRSSLSEMLRRMEERDLIRRVTDAADARAKHLSLLPAAEALLPDIKKAERATVAIVAKAVGGAKKAEELRVALRGLIKPK